MGYFSMIEKLVQFIGHLPLYTNVKKNTKEAFPMKKATKYAHLRIYKSEPIYPNAADHNYFARKALDVMTIIVSSMGFVTAMLFLVTMA